MTIVKGRFDYCHLSELIIDIHSMPFLVRMDELNKEVIIHLADTHLSGQLCIPTNAKGIVIFSHGSGSSRFSKRNLQIAAALQKGKFGTLLFDLLTPEEDTIYANRFDIELLTGRLIGATEWLESVAVAKNHSIGYFGASTGAACALQAAARVKHISAIVSTGGRPDLASTEDLNKIEAPVLLIVGSLDEQVLQLNRLAFNSIRCHKEIVIVNGATHLFEEKGKLDEVGHLALAWFEKHLKPTLAKTD